jgi:glutathione peroxidase-family protein
MIFENDFKTNKTYEKKREGKKQIKKFAKYNWSVQFNVFKNRVY